MNRGGWVCSHQVNLGCLNMINRIGSVTCFLEQELFTFNVTGHAQL